MRQIRIRQGVLLLAILSNLAVNQAWAAEDTPAQLARGIVFHDKNNNGVYDAGDPPLAGIRVSNGLKIVQTNAEGRYELPVTDDTILFVIKPRNWRTPLSPENLPRFYYIHKPQGSPDFKYAGVAATGPLPASVDFPLYPQAEPEKFQAILFGDTQPRDQKEVDYISQDIIPELIGTKASLGVTLGDIAFDNLETFEPLNKSIALLGIPWYNVMGNHDINYDAKTRELANETYERVYGPSYYSFEHGPVHFVVIDNIEWLYNTETKRGQYRGGLGPKQVQFIENDLKLVPENQLVVLMMHIPITNTHDRHNLYRLIEKRKYCLSISGHTHDHQHVWIKRDDGWEGPEPHHHIINVTVCGSWWSGALDERRIPHTTMADGGPNGYSILTFDGTDYILDYKAAGRDKNYQMEIDAPEEFQRSAEEPRFVYVNFFNGSEKSRLRIRFGSGDWREMTHTREEDPKFRRTFDAEVELLADKQPTPFRKLPNPKPSSHLWKLEIPRDLPVGTLDMQVEATDHWKRTFQGHRVLRVTE